MANRSHVTQADMRAKFRDDDMQHALDKTTAAIKVAIENQSPVQTGRFQDSIRTRRFPLSRRVYSVDPFGHIVEWGGLNVQGPGGGPAIVYAPFRRAVRSLRLKFIEAPKATTGGGTE